MAKKQRPKIDPERIRCLRERVRLTGAQFAEKLRVDRKTIWRWESGKSQPSEIHRHQMQTLWGYQFGMALKEDK